MPRIQLKRGLKANLPSTGMLAGEALVTTDRGTLHIATSATTKIPVVPAHEDLPIMPAVDGAADLIMIYDASEAATQKEKSISFNNFKTALNIPLASTDEKVAVVSGGTSGFVWGTDGTNGVVRMNSSMAWSKDAGNAFVTLAVGDVDCGTF
jgi:Major tropism determinant N-terminal domain